MVLNARDVKRLVSARLLRIQGVTGVGAPQGRLTVYLQDDSSALREQIAEVVEQEAPGTPIAYEVSGPASVYIAQA